MHNKLSTKLAGDSWGSSVLRSGGALAVMGLAAFVLKQNHKWRGDEKPDLDATNKDAWYVLDENGQRSSTSFNGAFMEAEKDRAELSEVARTKKAA